MSVFLPLTSAKLKAKFLQDKSQEISAYLHLERYLAFSKYIRNVCYQRQMLGELKFVL